MTNKLAKHWEDTLLGLTYTQEALDLMGDVENHELKVYVLLTDTKTRFSKISRFITGDPYNHVSLMLVDDFDSGIYTFSLSSNNGLKGGFVVEGREMLKGSNYSLYSLGVSKTAYETIKQKVEGYVANAEKTTYNHLGLFNALFKKDFFNNTDAEASICSEFVVEVLKFSGITLFKDKSSTTIRPYELVKSKLLKFVRRGVIK